MTQPAKVVAFFQSKLACLGHECAGFLYLDTQLKPIRYIEPIVVVQIGAR